MKTKYLTKETVVEDFKTKVLPKVILDYGKDEDIISALWELNLDELFKSERISRASKLRWELPKN